MAQKIQTLPHFLTAILVALLITTGSISQTVEAELLEDVNGDGVVSITAYGDSITYGVGDGTQPGQFFERAPFPPGPAGYPARVSSQLGVSVANLGDPGEVLTGTGVERFPAAVQSTNSDLVLIMEGANDAIFQTSTSAYGRALQKSVNASIALGRLPVLLTLPPPCCNHSGSRPFVRSYSDVVRARASRNDLTVIDVERAWDSTCEGAQCSLYNLPEGLHPNQSGYTAIAQTIMAGLLGINIFVDSGAAELENALGLAAGSVIVKPDVPALQ